VIVAKDIFTIRALIKKEKSFAHKIAVVATMGALHEGHIELIRHARTVADIVVVTIFINQAQFNDQNDYLKYPRHIEADIKKLKNIEIDYIFCPAVEEIYPQDFSYQVIPTTLTDCLCGYYRQGHFAGVSLIITKLFNIIQPDLAIFGQKDFQQLQIVKKLTKDLNFEVKIIGHKTIRQKDGLALSSRNQRLTPENLIKAAKIYNCLNEIKNIIIKESQHNFEFNFKDLLQKQASNLISAGFEKIDYLEIREEQNLKLIHKFTPNLELRIFIAVYLQGIRLIDNLPLYIKAI
jgi:pantoate--beta-alanine ligase